VAKIIFLTGIRKKKKKYFTFAFKEYR